MDKAKDYPIKILSSHKKAIFGGADGDPLFEPSGTGKRCL